MENKVIFYSRNKTSEKQRLILAFEQLLSQIYLIEEKLQKQSSTWDN